MGKTTSGGAQAPDIVRETARGIIYVYVYIYIWIDIERAIYIYMHIILKGDCLSKHSILPSGYVKLASEHGHRNRKMVILNFHQLPK